ncbi:substrate-binding domain-containing protein, partial [Dapis sp. BLCC M229]|uniref:substrate-binding domain-containing protein n=1 Tax=Dapis sp. BLCC M229 TaxID=3400188 RepID=UPI003CE7FBE1
MSSSSKKLFQISVVLLTLTATPKPLAAANLSFLSNTILAQSVNSDTTYPLPESLPSGTNIRLSSSSSMVVTNQALIQRYEEKYPDAQVELVTGDTSRVLEALLKGETDLIAVGRRLTAREKNQGLVEVPINRGKIAIIVAPDNPFQENLSFEQFAKILRGEITNWSEVGGPKKPIRFIDRPESSDTREALKSYEVFKKSPFRTGSNTTQVSEDDTAAVVKELGKDGISYAIADQVLNKENVRVVQMHKTLPNDPRYPYSQPRSYVYKKEAAPPEVLAFLGLVTSQAGQQVVAAADKQGRSDLATITPVNKAKPSEVVTSPSAEPQTETALNKQEETDSATAGGVATAPSAEPQTETALNKQEETDSATAGGVATAPSPDNKTETTLVQAPTGDANKETEKKGFPWWILLLLGIPLVGALLWGLLRGRGDESVGTGGTGVAPGTTTDSDSPPVGGTPVTGAGVAEGTDAPATPTPEEGNETGVGSPGIGVAPIAGIAGIAGLVAAWASQEKNSQITLSPNSSKTASATWSVPQADKEAAKSHGGQQYQLRVYDVTDIDLDSQAGETVQEHDISESSTHKEVESLDTQREYQAEIGYVTDDGEWLKLARSQRVHILADEVEVDTTVPVTETTQVTPETLTPEATPEDGNETGVGG